MKKNKPVILVTGGAGYIGSHMCKTLFEQGYLPIALDNLEVGHEYSVQWGPLVIGDLNSPKFLESVFQTYPIEAVMHFAADALVVESMQNPAKYYRNNVCNTLNLLDAMIKHDVHSLIFSSTCATYGPPQTLPICEKHPQEPVSPYGKSKLMMEQILQDYETAYGLQSICLRYFNAAGAALDQTIGEDREIETHLIPLVIQAALGKRENITVFGTDFPTRDGSAIRDYIHVMDLAKAHCLALEHLQKNQKSMAINLGTTTGTSVLEVIEEVQKLSRRKIPVVLADKRKGEPASLVADNSMAKTILGWTPKYSMQEIVQTAWHWHQSPRFQKPTPFEPVK